MSAPPKAVFRVATRVNNVVYRASRGRLMNRTMDRAPVFLLTVTGRRTGARHTVPVAYFPLGDGWVVVGSAGGQTEEPQWFRNLRAADHAEVLVRDQRHEVSVRVLEGVERDAAFTGVVAAAPGFAEYENRAGRPMPVALLSPR